MEYEEEGMEFAGSIEGSNGEVTNEEEHEPEAKEDEM